jgi:repressor LexA
VPNVMPEPTGFIKVPAAYTTDGMIAFPVRGDCMSGDDIRDGDYVLVDPAEPVTDGDIAVVKVKGYRTMVKRLYRHGAAYRLMPSNPDYPPLIVTAEDTLVIVGKVLGRVRLTERQENA